MAVIDLHIHPRMDSGMPFLFRGCPTRAPAEAKGETVFLRNQLSLQDLLASDVRLILATLYASPVFSQLRGGYFAELLRQAKVTRDWAAAQGLAVITTPDEAEAVCRSKDKLGVIIAVEGTHGILTEQALDALYEAGVRLVTITHLVDSPWAGAAKLRYWPFPEGGPGGPEVNKRDTLGLTPLGRRLLPAAVKRGLLIDLSHSSDLTFRHVVELFPDLPAIFTHQSVREFAPCERSMTTDELKHVAKTGGLTGVTFNAQFIGPGIQDVVDHAKVIVREAGPGALALGSDFNGFITRVKGVANSEGYARVLDALKAAGLGGVRASAEAFANLWRRYLKAAAAAGSRG